MKNKILPVGVVVLTVLLVPAFAADVDGRWFVRTLRGYFTNEIIFSFKAAGAELTGTVSEPQGETAISEGKINGDEISFAVTRGSGGREVKMRYKGKVSLNQIEFTSELQGGNGRPLKFVARREFPRHGDVPLRRHTSSPSDPIRERIIR